jgi:hypothetical protein
VNRVNLFATGKDGLTFRPEPGRSPRAVVAVAHETTLDETLRLIYLGPIGTPLFTFSANGLFLAAKGECFGCKLIDDQYSPPASRSATDSPEEPDPPARVPARRPTGKGKAKKTRKPKPAVPLNLPLDDPDEETP